MQLTVDHVVPVALGGSDDPSNLAAACPDCNSGKAASNPDAELVAQVSDDAVRWAAAMRRAAENWLADRDAGAAYGDVVARTWDTANHTYRWGRAVLEDEWTDTVERWRGAGLPSQLVVDAIGIAMRRKTVTNRDVWRYACGIVWSKLTELQEAASAALVAPRAADAPRDGQVCPECQYTHVGACGFWVGWRIGLTDCAVSNTDTTAAHAGHPDHYQLLALSRVVDRAAHEWAATWPYPSELYPIYSGRGNH